MRHYFICFFNLLLDYFRHKSISFFKIFDILKLKWQYFISSFSFSLSSAYISPCYLFICCHKSFLLLLNLKWFLILPTRYIFIIHFGMIFFCMLCKHFKYFLFCMNTAFLYSIGHIECEDKLFNFVYLSYILWSHWTRWYQVLSRFFRITY